MKSLPSRGSDAPHVHPRLRKRPPRCTLDCGFKTSESPALRGFVAERCPTTGTSLYLVLKSNGLRHSKNSPVKFGFSPKIVPAYIVKKLPSQRCPQPLLIPIFNFSHKWPTFAFTGESGYTLGPAQRIAHNGTHGETGAFPTGALSLPSDRFARFGNPAWPGVRTANFAAFGPWSRGAPEERREPSEQRCAYARRCPKASRPRWAAQILLPLFVQYDLGVVSLLSERSARSQTSPGRVSERQVLPLLGLGRGCSQRTQKAFGTAMRLCASLFRGVAAPLGCVIQ